MWWLLTLSFFWRQKFQTFGVKRTSKTCISSPGFIAPLSDNSLKASSTSSRLIWSTKMIVKGMAWLRLWNTWSMVKVKFDKIVKIDQSRLFLCFMEFWKFNFGQELFNLKFSWEPAQSSDCIWDFVNWYGTTDFSRGISFDSLSFKLTKVKYILEQFEFFFI